LTPPAELHIKTVEVPPGTLERDCVSGVTVGPGVAPTATAPATGDLLEKMVGYVQTGMDQGWIDAPELPKQFTNLLNAAKAAAAKNDAAQALQSLRTVVMLVDEHTAPKEDKGLTSEAVALLKLNAEFLIARLEGAPVPQATGPK
jgi:hypothetical protein